MKAEDLVGKTAKDAPHFKYPWTPRMPTLTAHSQIVLRYTPAAQYPDNKILRLIDGVEIMRFIGWDLSDWNPSVGNRSYTEALLRSLGGNAFSGFVVSAEVSASLAWIGQCLLTKQEDKGKPEDNKDQAQECSSGTSSSVSVSSSSGSD